MSDFKSLFLSDEFKAYRRKQVELLARSIETDIYAIISGKEDRYAMIEGKMEMADALIKLPASLTEDEGLHAILDRQSADDMAYITQYLIRRRFNVELRHQYATKPIKQRQQAIAGVCR